MQSRSRLAMALALAAGFMGLENKKWGDAQLFSLRNHYRGQAINGGQQTGVAAHKRAATKRKNIRARSSKRKSA